MQFSKDPNCEELSRATNAEVVISSSGLKTIFDNFGPQFDTTWDIPVIIREYEDGKRIIFIDKPLPTTKGIISIAKSYFPEK